MAWLVDDVAEAALGPWGLLVGVGVGVGLLARKRLAPLASTAVVGGLEASEKARDWVAGQETTKKVRGWAGGVAATAAGLPVVEKAQTALAEVGDWWSDLYAEARSEWDAGRTGETSAATRPTSRPKRASRRASPKRVRDASGRFVKKVEDSAE